jgi:hypothetical protein|nr:MAG TPA: hypothetical protein [Caudoviricetes sp.]
MTRKEWVEKHLPAYIDDRADGGVIGCPNWYHELTRMDPSILLNWSCKGCHEMTPFMCELCWNTKLNVNEERRTKMTRKEWMLENHPNAVCDGYRGGVLSCPGKYRDLVDIDPSAAGLSSVKCSMHPDCTECWNAPLPEDRVRPSDKVEIRKTMGEPHIKDAFYTIVRYPIGKYWLYLVGEFSIISMSAVNDTMVKCVSFDYDLQYQYTFFYNLIDKVVSLTPDMQYQAKSTPNLDRSLFLERRDAIEALEKWTGNVVDKSYYFLKQKGE